jgi:hypothetical protein
VFPWAFAAGTRFSKEATIGNACNACHGYLAAKARGEQILSTVDLRADITAPRRHVAFEYN